MIVTSPWQKPGRLNACPTKVCKLLTLGGGAGAFACVALALSVPVFAQDLPVCDPNALGAQADGVTKDTAAIQAAIDMCAAAGGGIVHLSTGTYLSAPLVMKTNVT